MNIAIIIGGIVALIIFFYITSFLNLWLQALFSNAQISIFQLIGMRLRKVPPRTIVEARILAVKAGQPIEISPSF